MCNRSTSRDWIYINVCLDFVWEENICLELPQSMLQWLTTCMTRKPYSRHCTTGGTGLHI